MIIVGNGHDNFNMAQKFNVQTCNIIMIHV